MAGGNNDTDSRQEARKGWLWSRGSSSSPDESPLASPPSSSATSQSVIGGGGGDGVEASPQNDPRLDTTRKPPEHLRKLEGKLDPAAFQTNFPHQAQEHASVSAAFKTIKPEDFLSVSQTPCARNGYIAGIISGGLVGGLKFIMRAPIPKVANWAVGGTILGAAVSYEWCQYKRRQERVRMKRTVEVYQEAMQEKHRKEADVRRQQREEKARLQTEEAQRKPWYRPW